MTAKKTNADYCKAAREKAKAEAKRLGLSDMTVPVANITLTQARRLVKRHGFQGIPEMLQTIIAALDAMGDKVPPKVLVYPRKPIVLSDQALHLQQQFNAKWAFAPDENETEEDDNE